MQTDTFDQGWDQVRAGLVLIQWSQLAHLDHQGGKLIATSQSDFEAAAVQRHGEFGRVISWIVFAVGNEYVFKGACLVRQLGIEKPKKVLRAPNSAEDIDSWVQHALAKDPSALETVTASGTLGELPIDKLVEGLPDRELIKAAFELLRQSIRNRDAHQYVRNVRAAHFSAVARLFVPALNALFHHLDQNELRSRAFGSVA